MTRERIKNSLHTAAQRWSSGIALSVCVMFPVCAAIVAHAQPDTASSDIASAPAPASDVEPAPISVAREKAIRPTEFSILFGQTVGSLRIYAFAQDRSEELISTRYLHPSGSIGPLRCDYIIQVIPVYRLIQPKYYNYNSIALTTERRSTFGTAVLPVGERVILNPRYRFQAALYSNGGFSYFTRRILSEGGTRLNMSVQFGTEFEYALGNDHSISWGYAINHLSNGNINLKNPGLDANLLYVAYSIRQRRFFPPVH
jgi:Lipid A 3-O-deacylase (PagL)